MSDEQDDNKSKESGNSLSVEARIVALTEKLSRRVDVSDAESLRRDEENKRNIEFIIRQQAQFAADMREAQERWARSEQRWERTEQGIRALLSVAEIHEREIVALVESQTKLTEEQAMLARSQAEDRARLDQKMAETGERLNALVNVVERMISERRNGGSGNAEA